MPDLSTDERPRHLPFSRQVVVEGVVPKEAENEKESIFNAQVGTCQSSALLPVSAPRHDDSASSPSHELVELIAVQAGGVVDVHQWPQDERTSVAGKETPFVSKLSSIASDTEKVAGKGTAVGSAVNITDGDRGVRTPKRENDP